MIIKDSMVIIHLAKITLLEKSCDYFKKVIIPKKVYEEITFCGEKEYTEIKTVKDLIEKKKINVKEIKDKKLLEKLSEFSIHEGEAEAIALCWKEKAEYFATDDDNVRKKSVVLNIKIIGTPSIILKLYKEKMIEKEKFVDSLSKLKKIGWFSNAIIDKILMEGK